MELPEGCYLKEISARFNQDTISRELRSGMTLSPELWGKLVVEEGEVTLAVGKSDGEGVIKDHPRVIPAGETYRVFSTGATCLFHIEYYHEPRIKDGEQLASMLGR